jgi:hypothetical protein
LLQFGIRYMYDSGRRNVDRGCGADLDHREAVGEPHEEDQVFLTGLGQRLTALVQRLLALPPPLVFADATTTPTMPPTFPSPTAHLVPPSAAVEIEKLQGTTDLVPPSPEGGAELVKKYHV